MACAPLLYGYQVRIREMTGSITSIDHFDKFFLDNSDVLRVMIDSCLKNGLSFTSVVLVVLSFLHHRCVKTRSCNEFCDEC